MKIGISLQDEIVNKIDKASLRMGVSRSAYIAISVSEKLKNDEVVESMPEMISFMKKITSGEISLDQLPKGDGGA